MAGGEGRGEAQYKGLLSCDNRKHVNPAALGFAAATATATITASASATAAAAPATVSKALDTTIKYT